MSFKLGIVGLPNVGKSTLFNAISNSKAEVSNYPFTTIDPNIAVVEVPDERIKKISSIYGSEKSSGVIIEFYDIAGLVKGANKGEGLGNQFLSCIREVDAIIHVVRDFRDANISHVETDVNPHRDIEIINSELLLSDLAAIDKKIASDTTHAKTGNIKAVKHLTFLEKIKAEISKGTMAYSIPLKEDEDEEIKELCLLTKKPQLIVVNVDENNISGETILPNQKFVVPVCAKLESDIRNLQEDEARQYLNEAGIQLNGIRELINKGFELLNLITFFTANKKETRAWTVKKGTKAANAAGKIHTDMEKGFISAEIISFDELLRFGSYLKAKESGLVKNEGRNYEIKDGDIAYFKFNV